MSEVVSVGVDWCFRRVWARTRVLEVRISEKKRASDMLEKTAGRPLGRVEVSGSLLVTWVRTLGSASAIVRTCMSILTKMRSRSSSMRFGVGEDKGLRGPWLIPQPLF